MLDWLFGSSKPEKKEEPADQKLNKEDEWVYDFIKQYLLSPIWKNPLLDFIEENCSVFEDVEQNKFEYTKIFQQFISICTILIESIVEETGITEKTLEKCILKGLKSKNDRKIFTQVLVCDNFEMFKRVMISKNKELEAEAQKKIRDESNFCFMSDKVEDKVQDQIDEMERERLEIEQAIALSLALEQKAKEQEEEEFQEAIRQSQLSAEVEVEEKTKKEEKKPEPQKQQKPKKSLLGDLPPLMLNSSVKTYDTAAEYNEEKERLKKQIKELKANQQQSQEASEERKKRLVEQRELLKKKKQEERQLELKTFVENKQATSIPEHKVSEEELLKRKKLMERLKQQLKSD